MNASIAAKLRNNICSKDCSGLCTEEDTVQNLTRWVGNDEQRAKIAHDQALESALKYNCSNCSLKCFKIAEVFDKQLELLQARKRSDSAGARRAMAGRDALLRSVGYAAN